jgi:methanogenic corrinoid protein MtbC1
LEQASVHLTKLKFINVVVVPLCKKIGELWRGGELKIINEHMATPIIRSVLWNLLNSIEVTQVSPRIVIATPLYHHHDLGALAIALIARESGWRSSFFGSNLPADEIAAAVHRTKARAVALSITFCLDHHRLAGEIQKLRGYLSRDIAFFIGGQGAAMVIDHPDIDNVQHLSDLESLNAALDNLLKRGH